MILVDREKMILERVCVYLTQQNVYQVYGLEWNDESVSAGECLVA